MSELDSGHSCGGSEALRFKFFFRFLSTTPIIYAYGLFSCWTYCWTFRSTLNLARLPLKRRSATMEIRGELAVTPLSATRRFPPTRWHPRRAGTGRAPRASRCWRRRSNSAPVHPHFSCDEDVTLPPAVAHGFVNAMRDFFAEKNPTKRDAIAAHQLSVLRDHQGPREEKLWL